ncbi:MAG: pyridoxamine 5'-phosphate oxidase family protein [Streptosporangiaceae bacterium]|nr:pyridoxamine 5'-phosphate oxidase family protein [Streptosporangiaceae bacterium]MBV9855470.1 pyridoxamine 5'-phosphate oxidase family protein [Streptosporangiaceae bacterium]
MPEDPHASVIAMDAEPGTEPLSWDEVRQRLAAERSYWVATTRRDGRPHVRPVLAVWVSGKIYSTTSPGAAKGRNLELRPECSVTARGPAFDIVVEGSTAWVEDRHLLEQVASAYDSKYSWPLTITKENMFDAPYGAPTAGPAPYRAYEITPRLVYAFGTGDNLGVRSTRFTFPAYEHAANDAAQSRRI